MTLQVFILNNLIRLESNCFVVVNDKEHVLSSESDDNKYLDNFNQIENIALN